MKNSLLALSIIAMMAISIIPVKADFVSILTLNPEQGVTGTSVDLTGRTEPNVVIDICYSKTENNRPSVPCTTVLESPTSDPSGRWSATVTIPESVAGRHPILAVERGLTTVQATREFTVIPKILLNGAATATGAVDDRLTVAGTGFAGSSRITVNYDNAAVPGCVSLPSRLPTVSTDQFGSFSAECRVPESDFTIPDGRHDIEAVDTAQNFDPNPNTFFLIPSVTISPTRGPVGVPVNNDVGTTLTTPDPAVTLTVQARGFVKLASVTVCFQRGGPFQGCTTGRTSALGSFQFQFPTPEIPAGSYVFDANQTVSGFTLQVPTVRTAAFTVQSDLDLNPDHAKFADEVEATGTGFAASTSVEVTLRTTVAIGARPCSGSVVLTLVSGTTRPTGSFFLNFSTPSQREVTPPHLYQVLARDGAGNEACADFIIGVFLRVRPGTTNEGKVGDTVSIQGSAFTPRSTVGVRMVSNEPVATRSCDSIGATFTADANGDFQGTFTVPNCNRGDYRIVGTDNGTPSRTGTTDIYRVFPWIDITPKIQSRGAQISVTATGFARTVDVDIIYLGAGAATDQLAPRRPIGFGPDNARTVWNGTLPQDLSPFAGRTLILGDLVSVWQVETVGGETVVATMRSGNFGNFVTTFSVPESWGGYHPVYGRESLSRVACGPDGSGPVVSVAVLCGQPFRNLPTVRVTPSSGIRAGQEILTLEGSGHAWWDHYSRQTVSGREPVEVNNVYRLAFDFGGMERYVDEARHIMNGLRDASWDAGSYLPVALNMQGTIVYWDFKLEDRNGNVPAGGSLGQIGSPFLRAPSFHPGDTNVVAYRLVLGSLPTPDRTEAARFGVSIRSAEVDTIGTARSDILSRIGEAQTAIVASIGTARDAILSRIGEAQTAIVASIGTARDAILSRIGEAQTAIVNRISTAQDAITTSINNAQTAVTNRIAQAQDAIHSDVVSRAAQSTADQIKSSTDTVKQDTSDLKNSLPLVLQTPLGYVIAILAAIAALGSIAAALITSRRLKVAG